MWVELMKTSTQQTSREETHQTVPLKVSTASGPRSIQIGFSDQRISAHGGLALMSAYLQRIGWRKQLAAVLPQAPRSPNAFAPVDVALGFMAGVWCGADKFSRVGHLAADPLLPEVLGTEALPSQPTLTRFFRGFSQPSNTAGFGRLSRWLCGRLPSQRGGYTLDLDSTAIVHEDGHQEGVRVGYTPRGLKPAHHPLLAALAEAKLVCGFWLRSGHAATLNNAPAFLDHTLAHLPAQVRVGLVRADAGFCSAEFLAHLRKRGLDYIVVTPLHARLRQHCRHEESAWMPTGVPGLQAQEVTGAELDAPGRRVILLRQRVAERPEAGGKRLLEVPGYRFQALVTSLPRSWSPVAVWRRYNGRAEIENRIKELAHQFGLKSFCCRKFWATEAACQLAIAAYNLCVLFQRHLGQTHKVELQTLRFRLFSRAAVFSRAQGRPTLKFAIAPPHRAWWRSLLEKLQSPLPPWNCNSVGSLTA
jgi:DNA-directed RNA polymerase subunit N (RpoN/RPB10)